MKQIKLTQGKFALVDDEDFEQLNEFKWQAYKKPKGDIFYATSRVKGKNIAMHRIILSVTDSKILIDHRDRNGLNNQKSNLRIATKSQNAQNKKGSGLSKYLGVYIKKSKHYKRDYIAAQIKIKDKNTYIGIFETEEDAARAYDKLAVVHHGEFANLNFKN